MKFLKFATITTFIAAAVMYSGVFNSAAADSAFGNIDKVMGSAVVGSGEHYGNVSLVNGSVKMASNSSAKTVSLVNGGIKMRDDVLVDSAETVNGSIEAGRNFTVNQSLSTVNGAIKLGDNAVVAGDVSTVNGDITLQSAQLAQNISTVNGDITLAGNTVVKGDVVFKKAGKKKSFFGWNNNNKPSLHIAADAVVEGQIILEQPVELKLANPAMQAKVVERF
ncbi:MAG: hypothetical protein CML20_01740 [Rheinheimera sp.]|uniref:hypothetical protein n=1 Tax=Arsukibacterium sp. UBA3155 TaxID=1946058 RepID=UPI000C8AB097|nr:hypothetical protein [Arsukibacterium sp. UBA3155]MAD73523.1 hypothetical protein [Rheinheimera sp.]|tara:strand:+ start:65270 stop:65935 length:666 start_codon:yes stop_codon:yes gene_type:complete